MYFFHAGLKKTKKTEASTNSPKPTKTTTPTQTPSPSTIKMTRKVVQKEKKNNRR